MKKLEFFIELAAQELQAALIIYDAAAERENAEKLASEKNISLEELTAENFHSSLTFAQKIKNGELFVGDRPKKFFAVDGQFFSLLDNEKKDLVLASFSPIYRP